MAAIADQRGVRHTYILVTADGAGMRRVADLVNARQLSAEVAGVYSLDRAVAAFEQVRTRHTVGKTVLAL